MRNSAKPWLILLLTAPIPLTLFGILSYNWYQKQTDSTRTTRQFIQRQNAVIAADATTIAEQVARFLVDGVRAVRTLPHLNEASDSWVSFLKSHRAMIREWNGVTHAIDTQETSLFSELSEWNLAGRELRRVGGLRGGPVALPLRNLFSCDVRSRCDLKLIQDLKLLPSGSVRVGRLVRWYSPERMDDTNPGAALILGQRSGNRIYLVSLNYQHLKSVLTHSTFPYEKRGDPLEGYQNGNYIYVTDFEHNIIAHPKYWHVYGFDRASGQPVPPMATDSDNGIRPLNIAKYQQGKLRDYFDRLLKRSFQSNSVDVFSAANLTGTNRVLAIAPILFKDAQFTESGVFGHVISGCNVDYYDDPKEQKVPYY